jgi:hypothetical protein
VPAPLASPTVTTARSGTAVLTAAFTLLLLGTLALFVRGLVVVLSDASAWEPAVRWTVASTALVLLPAFVGTAGTPSGALSGSRRRRRASA